MNIAGIIGIFLLNADTMNDFEQFFHNCVVKFENERSFQFIGESHKIVKK